MSFVAHSLILANERFTPIKCPLYGTNYMIQRVNHRAITASKKPRLRKSSLLNITALRTEEDPGDFGEPGQTGARSLRASCAPIRVRVRVRVR